MKTVLSLTIAALAALGLAAPAMAQARNCDRACLTGVMDDYLAALAARDPAGLNLHYSVKSTENGQRVNIGDGLWRTFSGGPSYRLDAVDAEAGQIAMLGIVEENGNRNFISIRLAVEENEKMGRGLEITEIETLVSRNVTSGGAAQMAMERDEFNRVVPSADRLSRGDMIRIADSYFTGLDTDESAAHVPFHPDCRRLENGNVLANNPDPNGVGMVSLSCQAQFDTGFSIIVTDIRERRFPIVDEEKGLVYALAFFDHDGAVDAYDQAPGAPITERQRPIRQPFSLMIAEIFQIEDASINQIEAVLTSVPYKMESGW